MAQGFVYRGEGFVGNVISYSLRYDLSPLFSCYAAIIANPSAAAGVCECFFDNDPTEYASFLCFAWKALSRAGSCTLKLLYHQQ